MSNFELPPAPEQLSGPVKAWAQDVAIPTYEPAEPDRNPLFIEKRVYQGSSGRVYPLPVIDAIATAARERTWQAIHIENEFIRVMVLPEIGGRIHIGLDKTNGYDFFYRQNVIKPALVGLAGPWASGGVEFNWPQHHRPATFMPVNWHIEEHADGARTIWLSDHDPMNRLKGMHGVCLRPGVARVELKVRLFNRTPLPQTFLWWANVAVHVHEQYQSFFPPDVIYVADHARRAGSSIPLCTGWYYGVDYKRRVRHGIPAEQMPPRFVPTGEYPPNDLTWYANIPVPTSYMAIGSRQDFSGGYDHAREAGLIHVADHHIAPGKKQWTWGNHEFGYAWDRHLTDSDGPYIELMGGVFTDNQPDFSFLAPGETRSFTQYWYPIQKTGPALAANQHAALSLREFNKSLRLGLALNSRHDRITIIVKRNGKCVHEQHAPAGPDEPILLDLPRQAGVDLRQIEVVVTDKNGDMLLRHRPQNLEPASKKAPPPATEPPLPADVDSNDELYVIGVHLDQYRHATRYPELYWREALRRDPGDSRCLNAMGLWHLKRGEFTLARDHFERAISRLTSRNANPYDGEAFYNLGLVQRLLGDDVAAYDAFYKSTWNRAWQAAAYLELARVDCARGDWTVALAHLDKSLRVDTDNLHTRNLKALVLEKMGNHAQSQELLERTAELDPLDGCCRFIRSTPGELPTQERLDIALDFARAGFWQEAIDVLPRPDVAPDSGTAPLVHYYRGYFYQRLGNSELANKNFLAGGHASPDWCFPSRLEEIVILQAVIKAQAADGMARYYLGNLFYDRKRHVEAIKLWEVAARLKPDYAVTWRNLGIGYFNVLKLPKKAARAYQKARQCNPGDARLLYEQDQLDKRIGRPIVQRLSTLQAQLALVRQRDDLTIEYCALLNQAGKYDEALAILENRSFQPWEGGEGQVLGQYVTAQLALGRAKLLAGKASEALDHFQIALKPPESIGEARHPLANCSDIYFYTGQAHAALGHVAEAKKWWRRAALSRGDFQNMAVTEYSPMTYYSILAMRQLGQLRAADKLLRAVLAYARELQHRPAKIDYFATSLPTLLLFDADLQSQQTHVALFLQAQMYAVGGKMKQAAALLKRILRSDPANALASGLLSEVAGPQHARVAVRGFAGKLHAVRRGKKK